MLVRFSQVKLAKRLVDSSFADRVFFSNSGTEANEAAIKFARKYQRVKAKERQEKRWFKWGEEHAATDFVAFTSGFHGRTLGALALTSKVQYRSPFEPIMPGVKFVEFGDLDAVTKIVRSGTTAAVFAEPVQGEGGVIPAVASFLHGLRKLCDETGVLLVFDEVRVVRACCMSRRLLWLRLCTKVLEGTLLLSFFAGAMRIRPDRTPLGPRILRCSS